LPRLCSVEDGDIVGRHPAGRSNCYTDFLIFISAASPTASIVFMIRSRVTFWKLSGYATLKLTIVDG